MQCTELDRWYREPCFVSLCATNSNLQGSTFSVGRDPQGVLRCKSSAAMPLHTVAAFVASWAVALVPLTMLAGLSGAPLRSLTTRGSTKPPAPFRTFRGRDGSNDPPGRDSSPCRWFYLAQWPSCQCVKRCIAYCAVSGATRTQGGSFG